MSKRKFISMLAALMTGVSTVTMLPFVPTPTLAADVVYNDFESSYGGWYGNVDNVVLTTENEIGYQSSKAMKVTGRYSSADDYNRIC